MSLSSSFRFEFDNPNASQLREAYLKQLRRIKNDEVMEGRDENVKEMTATNLYARWRETLDETAACRRLKRQNEEMAEEFRQSAREMIAIRRSQLKKLLDNEQATYEQEFSANGLAFYKQRT